ncbi:MAG: hypothetical protein PHX84_02435 [Candidatus Shapirobacteria bacterium]|jgi:hypothetical protein|nr:hypothetical protein [Candidatus Shapirobacteria bacterium]
MAEFKRSRLNRKTNDQITKKTIFLGLLTIVLGLLVLLFGLPLLVKFSIFLGEGKNKKNSIVEEKIMPPLAPRILRDFEATNSATIKIKGFAEAKVKVELYKNEISIGSTEVSENGDFLFDKIDLSDGDNYFSAIASTDKSGNSDESEIINVVYDTVAPSLTLTNPSEESLSVDSIDFDIVGKTDKGSSVLINNKIVKVDDNGDFKEKWQLTIGKNDLVVIARDDAGNETKKSISITYSL